MAFEIGRISRQYKYEWTIKRDYRQRIDYLTEVARCLHDYFPYFEREMLKLSELREVAEHAKLPEPEPVEEPVHVRGNGNEINGYRNRSSPRYCHSCGYPNNRETVPVVVTRPTKALVHHDPIFGCTSC